MSSNRNISTIMKFVMSGTSSDQLEQKIIDAEKSVINKVNSIISSCRGSRWSDPDFGPTSMDSNGTKSIYRTGRQTKSSMPNPSSIKWLRPNYIDRPKLRSNTFVDDASLFISGHCSGDVIQGALGDCWFISALAMIANTSGLLDTNFFVGGTRKDFPDLMNPKWVDNGIWVVRFSYNNVFNYVIIDDQLPCNPNSHEVLVFGRCEELGELWVPLAEKAYAKLIGSYDSLTGGLSQIALRELTGFCPESHEISIKETQTSLYGRKLLEYLKERLAWNSLLGASIENSGGGEGKGSLGLITGHAYSLLGLLSLSTTEGSKNLVVLRNPWGSGEWQGNWSDKSQLKVKNLNAIKRAWDVLPNRRHRHIYSKKGVYIEVEKDKDMFDDTDNGIFIMDIDDFQKYFTDITACIDFPESWRGRRVLGQWDKKHSGGNSSLSTWRINPAFKLTIPRDNTRVFIRLDQEEKRSKYGLDYSQQIYAIAFRVVSGDFDFNSTNSYPPKIVPNSNNIQQATFTYTESLTLELIMKKGNVYIIPCTYNIGEYGTFSLSVYCSCEDFQLECSELIGEEESATEVIRESNIKIDLGYDPDEYKKSISKIDDIITKSGVDPSRIVEPDSSSSYSSRYSSSSDLNKLLSFDDFKSFLTKKGLKSEFLTPDLFNSLCPSTHKMTKNDFNCIFNREKLENKKRDESEDFRIKFEDRKRRTYKKTNPRDDIESEIERVKREFGIDLDSDAGGSNVVTKVDKDGHSVIQLQKSSSGGQRKASRTRTITRTVNGVTTTQVITEDADDVTSPFITNSDAPDTNFTTSTVTRYNSNKNTSSNDIEKDNFDESLFTRYGIKPNNQLNSVQTITKTSNSSDGNKIVTKTIVSNDGEKTVTTILNDGTGSPSDINFDDEIARIRAKYSKR